MRVCMHACTYVHTHARMRACAHRNGRSRGLDHGRHLNYVSRPILDSLSFSPLLPASLSSKRFEECARLRSDIGIIPFPPPPLLLLLLPDPPLSSLSTRTFDESKNKKKAKEEKKVSLLLLSRRDVTTRRRRRLRRSYARATL